MKAFTNVLLPKWEMCVHLGEGCGRKEGGHCKAAELDTYPYLQHLLMTPARGGSLTTQLSDFVLQSHTGPGRLAHFSPSHPFVNNVIAHFSLNLLPFSDLQPAQSSTRPEA